MRSRPSLSASIRFFLSASNTTTTATRRSDDLACRRHSRRHAHQERCRPVDTMAASGGVLESRSEGGESQPRCRGVQPDGRGSPRRPRPRVATLQRPDYTPRTTPEGGASSKCRSLVGSGRHQQRRLTTAVAAAHGRSRVGTPAVLERIGVGLHSGPVPQPRPLERDGARLHPSSLAAGAVAHAAGGAACAARAATAPLLHDDLVVTVQGKRTCARHTLQRLPAQLPVPHDEPAAVVLVAPRACPLAGVGAC